MADTAHKTDAELVEHFDEPAVLEAKLDTLAEWVAASRHMVSFTGAGISTSAGIPDFRGPDGVWTMKAQGRKPVGRDYSKGFAPTAGHMGLVALLEAGRLRHLISTNTDGLHRKSGVPADRLTEIHGNTNLEDCPTAPIGQCNSPSAGFGGCGRKYFRDGVVRQKGLRPHEHATGRSCSCGQPLQDSIINFNENLRAAEVASAREQAAAADLMLCVGSSLRISNWGPETVARNPLAKLVVVNLQWTPFEPSGEPGGGGEQAQADMVIHARSDVVFAGLLRRLGLEPRPYQLTRQLTVRTVPAALSELKPAAAKAAARALPGSAGRKAGAGSKGEPGGGVAARLAAAGCSAVAVEVSCTDRDGATPDAFMSSMMLSTRARNGAPLIYSERSAASPNKLQLISAGRIVFVPAAGGETTELVVKLTGRHGESSIVLPLRVGPQLPVPGLPIESLNLILGWGEEKQAWEPTELPCLPPAGGPPVRLVRWSSTSSEEDGAEVETVAVAENNGCVEERLPAGFCGRIFGRG